MAAQVFALFNRAPGGDWSAQELAEFYRVEAILIQAGLRVVLARGLTDENEPWFAFCAPDGDEVFIHFARIDGRYLISSPAFCGTAVGYDFRQLVQSTLERHPVFQLRPKDEKLYLHPAALLVTLVAGAYFHSIRSAEAAPAQPAVADASDTKQRDAVHPVGAVGHATDAQQETLMLAALTVAMSTPVQAEAITIVVTDSAPTMEASGPSADPVPGSPMDLPGDAWTHETRNATSSVAEAPLIVPPHQGSLQSASPHSASSALAHGGASMDVVPGQANAGSVVSGSQTALTPVTLSTGPALADMHQAAPDLIPGAHLVPLDWITSIPKADIDLLHTLSAPAIVQYIPTLPQKWSTVLQTGAHAGPAPTNDTHPTAVDAQTTSAAATTTASAPLTSTTTASVNSTSTSVSQATTATAAHATTAPTTETPNIVAAIATVEQFESAATHPVFLMTDHSAIVYDAAAVNNGLSVVKSFTYDFNDGFSISLVGLPAEFAHVNLHG